MSALVGVGGDRTRSMLLSEAVNRLRLDALIFGLGEAQAKCRVLF